MKKTLFTAAAFLLLTFNAFAQCGLWSATGPNIVHTCRNVGIGIANPLTRTHIVSGGGSYSLSPPLINPSFECGTTLRLEFSQPTINGCAGFSLWDITAVNINRSLRFSTVGSDGGPLDVMTLLGAGNVGIGTTSPGAQLEIIQDDPFTPALSITKEICIGEECFFGTAFEIKNTVLGNPIGTRFIVKDTGSVGIGTANPLAALHVMGTGLFSQNVGIGTTNPGERLQVSSGNILVKGTNNFQSDGDEAILFLGDNNHSIKSIFGAGLRISTFQAQDAITILEGSGNVGIGTTTPTEQLEVAGTIRACEVRVELFGSCDYVFEANHQRMTPEERSIFYKNEKHMPMIEPGWKMERDGLNIAEGFKGLLFNLEEFGLNQLDLYDMIQKLNQIIDEQNKRIEELEKKVK